MKNALVVYESMFGATRQVAEAVADGLSRSTRCTVVEVATLRPWSTRTSTCS